MSIQLTVTSLASDAYAVPFTKIFEKHEISVGRFANNDLVLDQRQISAYHARIRFAAPNGSIRPTLFVKDLGSTNGTKLAEKCLKPQIEVEIKPNESLIIGDYLIQPQLLAPVATWQFVEIGDCGPASGESSIEESPAERPDAIASASIEIFVGAADLQDLDFTAKELFPLAGKILHRGSPLADVTIDAGCLGQITTDAEGLFSFGELAEGTNYDLQLSKEKFSFSPPAIGGTIQDGTHFFEISATQLFAVSGRITHRGQPIAGVTVAAVTIDGGEQFGTAVSDADGHYIFENVPENTKYRLAASKEKFVFSV